MFSSHDQSESIAQIICPYWRASSRQIVAECIIQTSERLEEVCRILAISEGRKGLFESKKAYVLRSYLQSEAAFAAFANGVELLCRFDGGKLRHWTGRGVRKQISSAGHVQLSKLRGDLPEGDAKIQIDITRIWEKLSPLLEDAGLT